jgi:hypothetical protein
MNLRVLAPRSSAINNNFYQWPEVAARTGHRWNQHDCFRLNGGGVDSVDSG